MALRNRVDPWGQLRAIAARGTLLGNRGVLHNPRGEIVAPWRTTAWITCRLTWKGRKRVVMSPGRYTELFFLDEATAFSAGHRPCAECRRARFREFKAAWLAANPNLIKSSTPPIAEIDRVLHTERAHAGGRKKFYEEELGALPDGTMIDVQGVAYLLWGERLLRWSFAGYTGVGDPLPPRQPVQVLTPASVVQTFRAGFRPEVHDSARAALAGRP